MLLVIAIEATAFVVTYMSDILLVIVSSGELLLLAHLLFFASCYFVVLFEC